MTCIGSDNVRIDVATDRNGFGLREEALRRLVKRRPKRPFDQKSAISSRRAEKLVSCRLSTFLRGLAAVPQAGGDAIYGQVDAGNDILIRIAGAISLQQLDLQVIERVDIGKAVAD